MTTGTKVKAAVEIDTEVRGKDLKRGGKVIPGACKPGHRARIVPGVSVTLYGTDSNNNERKPVPYARVFRIGDRAEYDSYNLSYIGVVTSIGPKTVTIVEDPEATTPAYHRLSLYDFDWRNYALDLTAAKERNAEEMNAI